MVDDRRQAEIRRRTVEFLDRAGIVTRHQTSSHHRSLRMRSGRVARRGHRIAHTGVADDAHPRTMETARAATQDGDLRALPGLSRSAHTVVRAPLFRNRRGLCVQPHRPDPGLHPGAGLPRRSGARAFGNLGRAPADPTGGDGEEPGASAGDDGQRQTGQPRRCRRHCGAMAAPGSDGDRAGLAAV